MQLSEKKINIFTVFRSFLKVEILETFGDTNVERKRGTHDITLILSNGACPIDAFEQHKIDVIHTAFTFYVRVAKGLY